MLFHKDEYEITETKYTAEVLKLRMSWYSFEIVLTEYNNITE